MKHKEKKRLRESNRIGKWQRIKSVISRFLLWVRDHIYTILYILMLIVLWRYIIYNWDACISMQFFSQFDGNNILFIVGLVLTILPFYDIEGKGIKLHRVGSKGLESALQSADSKYTQKKLESEISEMKSEVTAKSDGGDGRNE